jgi:hypothetical protein
MKRKYKNFEDLRSDMGYAGFYSIFCDVVDLVRKEMSRPHPFPHATVENMILTWWNNKQKPTLRVHRVSYFLLYHLKKEFFKAMEIKKGVWRGKP